VIDGNFDAAWDVYACDVDGDTDIDVLGAAPYADDIAWWENNNDPIADFNWTPLHPTVNDSINFIDLSYDSDGTIVNWTWDFGDGNISYEQNPIHQYTSAAPYTVTLTVTDNNWATGSISDVVLVCDVLVADAGGPYSGKVGNPITFTGSASGGTLPYTYSWDTGDGIVPGNPATHTYTMPGVYTIILSVTDDTGSTATNITTATITEEPIIVVESITGGLGITAVINNTGTADATDV
jgi:PKD repeat protein